MARKYGYRVYIGGHSYFTRAEDNGEAKRNAANQHRNRGYDRNKTIAQIMRHAEARRV